MVNAILTGFAYQIHKRQETVEFEIMQTQSEHICPACDFENGSKGDAVRSPGGMECLACGATWKDIAPAIRENVIPEPAEVKLASTALVDNRVFNKRHFEPARNSTYMPMEEEKSSGYGVLLNCFLLLISAGLFLQTWIWLNPSSKALSLSKIEVEEMISEAVVMCTV